MPDGPGKPVHGEYTVRCTAVEEVVSNKTGRSGTKLDLALVDGPELTNGAPCDTFPFPISLRLWNPEPGDEKKTIDALGSRIKEACKGFGVYFDSEGFDSDDFIGQEAQAEIGPQQNNPKYSEVYNIIVG
jgi:hypothetical protein